MGALRRNEMGFGGTVRTRDGRDVARRFVRGAAAERHVVYEAMVAAQAASKGKDVLV
jgi:hypothetical protein